MSDTPKRVKPSQAGNITPIRGKEGETTQAELVLPPEDIFAHLYSGEKIKDLPPTEWILPGRLVKRGLTAIYSAPGIGKSFVAIDMALAATLGEQWWAENFPQNCEVLYIAAERYSEVRDRLEAACKKRGVEIPANLHLYARPKALQVVEQLNYLIEIAKKVRPDVIIFDTFAKMTLGKKENASEESGPIAENFGEVVREAGPQCAGLIVHHAGKDETKGLRGSTALLGALDGVWKLERSDNGGLTLSVEKLNARKEPLPTYFRIEGQDMPDPQHPGESRSVGVLVSSSFAQVATGIEGNLAGLLCDGFEVDGASASLLETEYNRAYKPKAADADKVSRRSINRALKKLVEQGDAEMSGKGAATKYKPTAKLLAAYKAQQAGK